MKHEERLEIDIEFKDLLAEFLRKWRVVLIFAILGAVALGAKQYRSDLAAAQEAATEITYEDIEDEAEEEYELDLDEMEEVLYAVHLKADIDGKSLYISQSKKMSINPYKENRVTLQYQTASADATDLIVSYLQSGAVGEMLAKSGTLDLAANYCDELVTTTALENNGGFEVVVIGADETEANAITEVVKAVISDYAASDAFTLKVTGSGLSLVSETAAVVVDTELADFQNTYALKLNDDAETLAASKSDMTASQLAVYLKLVEDIFPWGEEESETEDEEAPAVSAAIQVSISGKAVVEGAIAGAVIALVLIAFAYLLTGKLRTVNEMAKLYGVKVLGSTRVKTGKQLKGLDGKIWNLQHKTRRQISAEDELNMVVSAIAVQGESTVLLTGSKISATNPDVIEKIKELSNSRNILVETGESLLISAEALPKAKEVGAVVLIEEKGVSKYQEILEEVRQLEENDIRILGGIVLNA